MQNKRWHTKDAGGGPAKGTAVREASYWHILNFAFSSSSKIRHTLCGRAGPFQLSKKRAISTASPHYIKRVASYPRLLDGLSVVQIKRGKKPTHRKIG